MLTLSRSTASLWRSPYSSLTQSAEHETPVELQGERDVGIAEALQGGTKTADAFLVRRLVINPASRTWAVEPSVEASRLKLKKGARLVIS